MKKINLLIIIVFVLCTVSMNAQIITLPGEDLPPIIINDLPPVQPDYYTGKTIISGTGFSFKKINSSQNFFRMQNINIRIYIE